MRRSILSAIIRISVAGTLALALAVPAAAAAPPTANRREGLAASRARENAYASDQVIVRFKPGSSATSRAVAHGRAGAQGKKQLRVVDGLEVAQLGAGVSVDAALAAYKTMPNVLYAEPNYIVHPAVTVPNDPDFGVLWALDNTGQSVDGVAGTSDADIDAPEAWDVTTGSSNVVIAIVDTGIDYTHPDLAGNMWANPGEIASNGLDDDGNGVIDDVHGYDALSADGDPMDDHGHGTACASAVAAGGNNGVGVAGVDWSASLMALKMMGADGSGTVADAVEALQYADAEGADVVNISWGIWSAPSQSLRDVIATMSDTLFVCAAGNNNLDIADAWPGGVLEGIYQPASPTSYFYPANFDLTNILVVGASDQNDARAPFSNFGATAVDVFAPGTNVRAASLPVKSIAAGATENPIFSEDFTDLTGWITWTHPYGPWTLKTDAFTSAPSSAGYGPYYNNDEQFLDQDGALDLSAADYPALRFKVRYDLEPGQDVFTWSIYDPVFNFTEFGSRSGDSGGAFETVVTDLSAFAGSTDRALSFGMYSDASDASAEGYDGVWIDDVEVFDLDASGGGSPWVDTRYSYVDGTSIAAPHATGIAGLLLALDPTLTPAQLKSAIVGGVDPKAGLAGQCVSGGRVNANTTVTAPISLADAFSTPVSVAGAGLACVGVPIAAPAPGVLANDVDPNGDTLTAVLHSGPSHGAVALSADGSFEYTPDPNYFGQDAFLYRARDGAGNLGAPAVVTIGVENTAPVAAADSYATPFGTTLTLPAPGLLANDTDAEDQPLAATLAAGSANGAVTVNPDGSLVFVPASGFSGPATFTYRITDSQGATSADTLVTVSVGAPAPPSAVYRFYNLRTGTHFYTSSSEEANSVTSMYPGVFQAEGVAYYVRPSAGSQPLHRFYNVRTGSHFYTASPEEANRVIATYPDVFAYEGTTYAVSPLPVPGAIPVYRFYNVATGSHFYTSSTDEVSRVLANYGSVYTLEGTAFWLPQ